MSVPLPHVAGVEHHYVTVRGIRVHYAEAGSGSPLVLQHGWPQHWWAWRDIIRPLAETHRVICPDLRGLGWSEGSQSGYEKSALAADLVALLDELGLDRVGLIGHDWGGFVGFLASLAHPERFSAFMALSIPHLWPPEGPMDPRRLLRAWYQVVLASPIVGPLAVERAGFPKAIMQKARSMGRFSEEELEVYDSTLRQPASVHASQQLYRSFLLRELVPLARGDFRKQRLTVPTRLVLGARDPIAQGVDDAFRPYADDMEIEWEPGVSHFLPEERPEAVIDRARVLFADG